MRIYKFIILLGIVSLFNSGSVCSQNVIGQPGITNYNYQDYEASSTNWWILEGDNGLMYFANGSGVLEYDGVNWRLITLEQEASARCLVKDASGTIYVGGFGTIGYLATDTNGELSYVSLVDQLPEEDREFAEVWEAHVLDDKIYFGTQSSFFVWDGETMEVIRSEEAIHLSAVVRDTFYARIWGKGLCKLEDGEFKLLPGGEKFADERIYVMLPYGKDRVLLGTRDMGFFLYDGTTFAPFKTELDDKLNGSIYLPGLALEDGNFIINSFSAGAYLMNPEGEIIQEYTVSNGLSDGSVDYVLLDSRGILWMALFNGIARVDLTSPFTYINSNLGLENNVVWDVDQLDGTYYFSTNSGIYYLKPGAKTLEFMTGTSGQGGDLIKHKGKLYGGTGDMGMIEIKGESFRYVRKSENYDFRSRFFRVSEQDPNRMFVHFPEGVATFYFDEEKQELLAESVLNLQVGRSFKEWENGEIWFTSFGTGEIHVVTPVMNGNAMDLENAEISKLTYENGLPDDNVGFGEYFGTMLAFTDDQTMEYNPETREFTTIEAPFEHLIEDSYVFSIRSDYDHLDRLWFDAGSGITVATRKDDGSIDYNVETFKELKKRSFFQVYFEPDRPEEDFVAWFCGPDGIVRYNGDLSRPEHAAFETMIRRIMVSGDSVLFHGAAALPDNVVLNPGGTSLTFDYAAPVYSNQKELLYSTYLVGLDSKWSDWTKQTSREYNNLAPGEYTFQVKGQSISGQTSEVTSFQFSVAYPWYRTWWAYGLLAAMFFGLIYLIVVWRTRLLRERQRELEEKVHARTEEVKKRMDELATVNNITNALTDKLQLKELIQLVGDEMKALFHADITYLALLDEDKMLINFLYQDGDVMPPMKYGQGLTSKIIQSGEPLLINRDSDIDAEYDKMGIKKSGKSAISYLGVPIQAENKVIGVLSVQSTQVESRFNNEDKRLLSTIAINVGVALHNAELFEEVKTAKARAEDANEAKSAFLSTVSHELRTPLTSVLGFAKIIKKRLEEKIFPVIENPDPRIQKSIAQVSENLGVVVSEGERLTTLINDVLDLAKIESGKMEWNMKPIFLQDVIARAIASTSSLFDAKKLLLKKNIPAELPLVNADEDKLIQVIINLLSNAVKFTDAGEVTIEAKQQDTDLIVSIRDTGIGIAEEDTHKVFERFRQAGDTLTDKPKGTGLGLPICREIVEHHGGVIWMDSKLNVGSTFSFSLPVYGEGAKSRPVQLTRVLTSLKKQIKHTSHTNTAKDVPTILVVDDDTPIRSLLRQELSEAGYHVREAADGKAALDAVRLARPDLIILDVMMPDINGFDVAAVLKNDPSTMDIPIIILSIVQDKERGMRIGVDRYLTKPINTDQLFHEVDVLLEQGVSNKKVLVIDQDASTVKSLSDVLSARGYKVLKSDAENLIESATTNQPDIIMLNAAIGGDPQWMKDLKLQKGMEHVMFFIYE